MYHQYALQCGFVTYPVPADLQPRIAEESDRIHLSDATRVNAQSNAVNWPEIMTSLDADFQEAKAKDEAKQKAWTDAMIQEIRTRWAKKRREHRTQAQTRFNQFVQQEEEAARNGLVTNSGLHQGMSPQQRADALHAIEQQEQQRQAQADGDLQLREDYEVEAATVPYPVQNGFVTFAVPLEPRKSCQRKSLSSLALTWRQIPTGPVHPASVSKKNNYLFTTRLLSAVESRFEYRDFLNWALLTLRRTVPVFQTAAQLEQSGGGTGGSGSDKLQGALLQRNDALVKMSSITRRMAQLAAEKKVLVNRHKEEKQKLDEILSSHEQALVCANECNQKLKYLERYGLQCRVTARKPKRSKLTTHALALALPSALATAGVIEDTKEAKQQVQQVADGIANYLMSEQVCGTEPGNTTVNMSCTPAVRKAAVAAVASAAAAAATPRTSGSTPKTPATTPIRRALSSVSSASSSITTIPHDTAPPLPRPQPHPTQHHVIPPLIVPPAVIINGNTHNSNPGRPQQPVVNGSGNPHNAQYAQNPGNRRPPTPGPHR
jgi:hypothetical protein